MRLRQYALFLFAGLSSTAEAEFVDVQCESKLHQRYSIESADEILTQHWIELAFKVPRENQKRFVTSLPKPKSIASPEYRTFGLWPAFDIVEVRYEVSGSFTTKSIAPELCEAVIGNEAQLLRWHYANSLQILDGYSTHDDDRWER